MTCARSVPAGGGKYSRADTEKKGAEPVRALGANQPTTRTLLHSQRKLPCGVRGRALGCSDRELIRPGDGCGCDGYGGRRRLGCVGLGSCRDCRTSRETHRSCGSRVDTARGDRSSVCRAYRPVHSRIAGVGDRCRKRRCLRGPAVGCVAREHGRSGRTYADGNRWVATSAGNQKSEESERYAKACNGGVLGHFPSREADHDDACQRQCQWEPRGTIVRPAMLGRHYARVRAAGSNGERCNTRLNCIAANICQTTVTGANTKSGINRNMQRSCG